MTNENVDSKNTNHEQYTEIGQHNGHKVAVATDRLGSQIIYGCTKDLKNIHLVSIDLGSHAIACNIAKEVVRLGPIATTWHKPINSITDLFMAIAVGPIH